MRTQSEIRTTKRLNDTMLEKLKPPQKSEQFPDPRDVYSDAILPALELRITKTGTMTWSVWYRVDGAGVGGIRGKKGRMTLGFFPAMKTGQARDAAQEKLEQADNGQDPARVKATEIETRQQREFETVVKRFIEQEIKPNVTVNAARNVERGLTKYVVPEWRGRQIDSIDTADVNDLLDKLKKTKSESIARENRKHLTRLFGWAAGRRLAKVNPMFGLRRNDLAYVARDKVIKLEELAQIWVAAERLEYPFKQFFQLLILTGQRRSEIANLQGSWLRPDMSAFEIPAAEYKSRRPHVVPLPPRAWRVLNELPEQKEGEFLLSTIGGKRPISGFSKAKALLAKVSEVSGWRTHDIRRSVATHLARRVSGEHIERLLGHALPGVASIYNRYTYLNEKRNALSLWDNDLQREGAMFKASIAFQHAARHEELLAQTAAWRVQIAKAETEKALLSIDPVVAKLWREQHDLSYYPFYDREEIAAASFEDHKRALLGGMTSEPGSRGYARYCDAAVPLLQHWVEMNPTTKITARKFGDKDTPRIPDGFNLPEKDGETWFLSDALMFLAPELRTLDDRLEAERREDAQYVNIAHRAVEQYLLRYPPGGLAIVPSAA